MGQPMINLTLVKDWGNLDLFVLPGFRERTFAGLDGRLRPELEIKQSKALYESSNENHHLDYAFRWSHTLSDWDVGLSYFNGTSRDPSFVANQDGQTISLSPYYAQMEQVGVDLLLVYDEWLYKFEGIYRDLNNQNAYIATVAGFEYTNVGVFESVWDIGWLLEYQYDNNDVIKQNDEHNALMLGTRIALNDVDGTEILLGYVLDLDDSDTQTSFIEASSRINDNWKWRLDAWFISSETPSNNLYSVKQDDYVQASLEYYF
tara:strand:- start:51 stop:833 length:783 start_codon:yes stop_codon:yes gene_type:complete